MTKQHNKSTDSLSEKNNTPKVTGIGGIFFFSPNPEKTREWYADNLGLEVNQWGSSFEFRNAHRPEELTTFNGVPLSREVSILPHPRRNS
ncbi:hypothetical protein [Litoribacter ruber]|uniref:hypothetical protein n=1 Tax=Litoribacter ruber TaxID=702568 RepID=UPI00293D60FB|nr:hypothetical protein [Litoribacter ruber]